MADRLQCLYRFWDDADVLLYVGITNDPSRRFKQHGIEKPWWTQVAKITLETHPSREAVLAAEANAIASERPLYNILQPIPPVIAEEMPDECSDCFESKYPPPGYYLPYRWREGVAFYACAYGHRWTCGWGHGESGDRQENWRLLHTWRKP